MAEERWYPAVNEPNVEARFDYYEILDIKASIEKDEKVHRPIIVLYERVRGMETGPARKVTEESRAQLIARFPGAWKAFEGNAPPVRGTLLDASVGKLAGLTEEIVKRLKFAGILTVENMAACSDMQCQALGLGLRKLRDEAKKFLDRPAELPEAAPKNKGGRPAGSKNKARAEQAAA